MTDDRLYLSTWEQMVEYKRVKDFGRDFNFNKNITQVEPTATDIIDDLNTGGNK